MPCRTLRMGWSCRSDAVKSKRAPPTTKIYAGNLQYLQRKLSPDLKKSVLILAAAAATVPAAHEREVVNHHSETYQITQMLQLTAAANAWKAVASSILLSKSAGLY